MGRINNFTKWLVMNINFLYSSMAIASIGIAIFVLASDWGSLDPNFFLGWCILIILFGIIVSLIAILGCMGVSLQQKRDGCWTGRRVLAVYQLTLIGTVVGILWMVTMLMSSTESLEKSRDSLDTDDPLEYDSIERGVAERFNEFFFSATNGCTDAKYVWFWGFVNDHCPTGISQEVCEACDDYSVTTCAADENSCYAGDDYIYTCPYEICREGILDYMIFYMKPMRDFMLAFAVFSVVLMLLVCMLICFTEKDSLEEMLIKTGTINRSVAQPEIQQRSNEDPRRAR